jgi:putative transposase
VDLNPVRSGLAAEAADYPWSSYGSYAGLRSDRLVTPHEVFWRLGNTPFAREAAYVGTVQAGISLALQSQLTDAALGGWALGSADFIAGLQALTPRRVGKAKAGRPAAVKPACEEY